jgi:Putative peptidoglycan binding domain
MKTKRFVFISCLAASALIASPALSKPPKKSARSSSQHQRMVARTTQRMPSHRYHQNGQHVNSHTGNMRYYRGTHYNGARADAGRQYRGTGYYSSAPRYRANTYYGGTRYYYGGGSYPYYGYYSGWPHSNWGYGASLGYYPYSYWGAYPYTYSNGYYSYYAPTPGYNVSLVATVQRRLGQLGYYHGAVDGIIGPQTRGAIAAFESRNGLVVDARISGPLLDTLGLG